MAQYSNHRSSRRGDKKKGHEKIFEEMIAENVPKMEKEIATHIQETHRVPNRINPK